MQLLLYAVEVSCRDIGAIYGPPFIYFFPFLEDHYLHRTVSLETVQPYYWPTKIIVSGGEGLKKKLEKVIFF